MANPKLSKPSLPSPPASKLLVASSTNFLKSLPDSLQQSTLHTTSQPLLSPLLASLYFVEFGIKKCTPKHLVFIRYRVIYFLYVTIYGLPGLSGRQFDVDLRELAFWRIVEISGDAGHLRLGMD